jgi:hypothetical protein
MQVWYTRSQSYSTIFIASAFSTKPLSPLNSSFCLCHQHFLFPDFVSIQDDVHEPGKRQGLWGTWSIGWRRFRQIPSCLDLVSLYAQLVSVFLLLQVYCLSHHHCDDVCCLFDDVLVVHDLTLCDWRSHIDRQLPDLGFINWNNFASSFCFLYSFLILESILCFFLSTTQRVVTHFPPQRPLG